MSFQTWKQRSFGNTKTAKLSQSQPLWEVRTSQRGKALMSGLLSLVKVFSNKWRI